MVRVWRDKCARCIHGGTTPWVRCKGERVRVSKERLYPVGEAEATGGYKKDRVWESYLGI